MNKFYILLASILWEIENDEIEESDFLFASQAFIDFNTGNYDYLIAKNERLTVKQDFNKVYEYLVANFL